MADGSQFLLSSLWMIINGEIQWFELFKAVSDTEWSETIQAFSNRTLPDYCFLWPAIYELVVYNAIIEVERCWKK